MSLMKRLKIIILTIKTILIDLLRFNNENKLFLKIQLIDY